MKNIIAIIWDFDKTLVNGYMQDSIFQDYEIYAHEFWTEVNALPKKYMEEQQVKVNLDTIYLNQFIKYAQSGKFDGLNNAKLRSYCSVENFYAGIPEIFKHTKEMLKNDPVCEEYNIKVEHYIVSEDDRIDMFAEADYSEGTTAYMWICNKVREFADNIKKQEQSKRSGNYSIPTHLV